MPDIENNVGSPASMLSANPDDPGPITDSYALQYTPHHENRMEKTYGRIARVHYFMVRYLMEKYEYNEETAWVKTLACHDEFPEFMIKPAYRLNSLYRLLIRCDMEINHNSFEMARGTADVALGKLDIRTLDHCAATIYRMWLHMLRSDEKCGYSEDDSIKRADTWFDTNDLMVIQEIGINLHSKTTEISYLTDTIDLLLFEGPDSEEEDNPPDKSAQPDDTESRKRPASDTEEETDRKKRFKIKHPALAIVSELEDVLRSTKTAQENNTGTPAAASLQNYQYSEDDSEAGEVRWAEIPTVAIYFGPPFP